MDCNSKGNMLCCNCPRLEGISRMAAIETAMNHRLRRPMRERVSAIADEPTKAEIMEDIRIGLQQAAAGEGRPAQEAFDELRRKLAGNAHSR